MSLCADSNCIVGLFMLEAVLIVLYKILVILGVVIAFELPLPAPERMLQRRNTEMQRVGGLTPRRISPFLAFNSSLTPIDQHGPMISAKFAADPGDITA